jgi:cytosine/creatinine deaminase
MTGPGGDGDARAPANAAVAADTVLLADARLPDGTRADIALLGDRIDAVDPVGMLDRTRFGRVVDCSGRLVTPGLTDLHLHADKAYLLDRGGDACDLETAIAAVQQLKVSETEETIGPRARRVLEACVAYGTVAVRVHAEVDPYLGLRAIDGVAAARDELGERLEVQLCAFAQEGIVDLPGTEALLAQALRRGADVIGGITYRDRDLHQHLEVVCRLAVEFEVPLDLHADLSLPEGESALPAVADAVERWDLGGRTLVGHATSLAGLDARQLAATARRLADVGIAVVALPRTDLYLDGVVAPLEQLDEHGVASFVASNNIENPFTPVGPPALPQVAAVYALVRKLGTVGALDVLAQRLWAGRPHIDGADPSIAPMAPADLCVWGVTSPWQIVSRGAVPDLILRRGRVAA